MKNCSGGRSVTAWAMDEDAECGDSGKKDDSDAAAAGGDSEFGGGANHSWRLIKQADQKIIWMLGLDVESGESLCRKVLEIVGHDDGGSGAYGGSQDMAVVRIG